MNKKKYLAYTVTYENGNPINKGDLLKANDSKNVLVRVEYKKDVNNADLPKTADTLNLTFHMEYVQDDGTGKDVAANKTGADTIKALAKTDTTNLVADDGTADHNTRYIGKDPNNYIKFNGETWRIIGVFNNIDDGTGKKETRLKIIRNDSLGYYSWDTSDKSVNSGHGENDWTKSKLMQELNTDYLGNTTIGTDGKWYNGYNNTKTGAMPTTILSSDAQAMIGNAVWNLGGVGYDTRYEDLYTAERESTVYTGRPTTWTGKVALMYPSDFGFATSGSANVSRGECLNTEIGNGYHWWNYGLNDLITPEDCDINDWLGSYITWTLSPIPDSSFGVNSVPYDDESKYYYSDADDINVVLPAVFLKSKIKISSGDGSESNPYQLSY